MKKTAALVLAVLLCLTAVAGCTTSTAPTTAPATPAPTQSAAATEAATATSQSTENPAGLPIVKEPVTYELACKLTTGWGQPQEGEFWQWLEQKTNIKIKWTTFFDSEANEKFSLMMGSGEYPDAFIGGLGGGDANIITYSSQGIYIPLNDLIDKNTLNFKKRIAQENPAVMNMITSPDGNIYAMPSILYNPVIYNNTFINKTWLDKLGLKVPTTTAEFENVLKAFKSGDPNGNKSADEIPMTFMFGDWGASEHGGYLGAFGYPLSPDYTLIDSGKVVYLGSADSFKAGAEWLAKLYSAGLIDKEVFTQDESQYNAKASADTETLGVFSSWDRSAAGKNQDQYVALLPLTGPNGDHNWLKESITGFYRDQFIITKKAANPDILMRWVDVFYTDVATSLNATYGIGPDANKAWNYDANGNIVMNATIPDKYKRGQQQLPFAPGILGSNGASILASSGMNKEKEDITASYLPYAQKFTSGAWERWPITFTTAEEKEKLSTLENDLITYSKNKLASWISGEANVDTDWDSYLKELNNIGLQDWLKIKQAVYDRYKGK